MDWVVVVMVLTTWDENDLLRLGAFVSFSLSLASIPPASLVPRMILLLQHGDNV
jgi:hypothetical protein